MSTWRDPDGELPPMGQFVLGLWIPLQVAGHPPTPATYSVCERFGEPDDWSWFDDRGDEQAAPDRWMPLPPPPCDPAEQVAPL